MNIRTRLCISLDGFVTTPDGLPVQLADPALAPGQSYGFPEFQKQCEAVLMGRTTFEPALGADRWPWPNLDVFVLGSQRPAGTPDDAVLDGALDKLGLIVLPLLIGDGMRLTPALSLDTALRLETESALPEGSLEITYAVVP